MIDKMQAHLTSKNMKRCKPLWGFQGLVDFYSPPGTVTPSLISPGKDWGAEQQATFGKTKILVKQSKTLGIAPVELPLD